jgi:hypothetical protein
MLQEVYKSISFKTSEIGKKNISLSGVYVIFLFLHTNFFLRSGFFLNEKNRKSKVR